MPRWSHAAFGELLRRAPETVSVDELAQGLRIPVTILGDTLRRVTENFALSPTQARVLSQLSAGDSLSISVLAASQELAVSSMTESVVKLEAAGLVVKGPSSDDRREVRVSITAEGRRRLDKALRARTDVLVESLAALSDEERRALAAALPALWRLADRDPDLWPRVRVKPPVARRRAAGPRTPRGTR
jgi:DNA-binding MarR family transcriptional regulator